MKNLVLLTILSISIICTGVLGIEQVEDLSNQDGSSKFKIVDYDVTEVEGQCTCDCCEKEDLTCKLRAFNLTSYTNVSVSVYKCPLRCTAVFISARSNLAIAVVVYMG